MTGAHTELFSDHLAQAVHVAQAPRGAIVFGQPLTIVATASIAEVAHRAEENRTGAAGHATAADGERSQPIGDTAVAELFHRFRATLLVETDEPFVEESWLGRVMTLRGAVDGLRVRIGGPVPRCAVVDLDPTTGERTDRLLRTLAATRAPNRVGEPFFGVYAEVVQHSGR
nr:MOSC domain-containing protein [Brevibacterium sp. XM4083]